MKKDILYSENAVSEALDFVTILGILLIATGMIVIAGYPMLKNSQEARHIENTRYSFTVLAENINKVVLGEAPSQSVELKMYGGMLSITGDSRINITAINSTADRISLVDNEQMGSIESTVGNTVVAYEGTGVWVKHPNNNTLVVSKPLITNRSGTLVIPYVKINPTGTSSIGGSGLGRVRARGVPEIRYFGNVSNITVTVTGNYTEGWENYFTNVMSWSICTSGGASGDCTARLNTSSADVYILRIQMDTEII